MPTEDAHLTPSGTIQGRDLGDEYLFYDRKGDQVHILNGTARTIYLLCDGTRSVEQVARAIAEQYGIDLEQARRDTSEAVDQLIRLGLLRRS